MCALPIRKMWFFTMISPKFCGEWPQRYHVSSPFISRGWKSPWSPWMVSCHVWWISLTIFCTNEFRVTMGGHHGTSAPNNEHFTETKIGKTRYYIICVFKKVAPLKHSTTSAQWFYQFPRFVAKPNKNPPGRMQMIFQPILLPCWPNWNYT